MYVIREQRKENVCMDKRVIDLDKVKADFHDDVMKLVDSSMDGLVSKKLARQREFLLMIETYGEKVVEK